MLGYTSARINHHLLIDRLRYPTILLIVGASYFVAGRIGLMLAFLNPSVSPVWPASGIALASLLLCGLRVWPAIFAGAFLVNFAETHIFFTSLGIASGNTLEGIILFRLLEMFAGGKQAFERVNGTMYFALFTMLATIICATIGVTVLRTGGLMEAPGAWEIWFTWWLGDMVGALTVAPLIVLFDCRLSRTFKNLPEALLLAILFTVVSAAVFGEMFFAVSRHYPLSYLALLPVIWAALRFGPRCTIVVVVLLSCVALFGTIIGNGPFALFPPGESLLLLQSFIGIVAITGMLLASAVLERRVSEVSLEQKVKERTALLEKMREEDRANILRLQSTIRHLPMAALLMDEKGNVLELNEAYCSLFSIGLPPEEAKLDPYGELLRRFKAAVADPEAHMQKVNLAMERKETLFDQEIHLKDGRIVLRDFIPVYDHGVHRGQLFLYRDVTRERRADTAKSEFMSLASHQLRTPLTAMRWSLTRLRKNLDESIAPDDRRLLAEGQKAAARMADTIDTMLKISRVEAKQDALRITQFDLCKLLMDKRELFRHEFESKRQSFTVECPGELLVETDITFLKEILRNLIQNAVKYTPEGGTIGLRAKAAPGAVIIEVEDTGYGIPRHQREHVFRKFFRGENVVNRDTSGTGLGLYLVSLIADVLQATIEVESEENRGTKFTFRLPQERQ